MPSLSSHHSTSLVKLLLLGDAKSGKTGSLVSLVKAGYKLRILDFDNLLDGLKSYLAAEDPKLLDLVEYQTFRDKRKATATGSVVSGTPKAFVDGMKMLDRWKYGETDLGVPSDWGSDCILVLDSLSRFSDAAYDWADPLVPTGRSGEKDPRAVYGMAQEAVENTLAMLTSEHFGTNVIVIAHGTYIDLPDGSSRIFPQSVGKALCPKIPTYFPNYIRYKNSSGKRTITFKGDAMIDLANAAPIGVMDAALPIETGLADFFAALREPPVTSVAKPTSLKLKRV